MEGMAVLPPMEVSSGDIPSEAKSDDSSAGMVGMLGILAPGMYGVVVLGVWGSPALVMPGRRTPAESRLNCFFSDELHSSYREVTRF